MGWGVEGGEGVMLDERRRGCFIHRNVRCTQCRERRATQLVNKGEELGKGEELCREG